MYRLKLNADELLLEVLNLLRQVVVQKVGKSQQVGLPGKGEAKYLIHIPVERGIERTRQTSNYRH